MTAPCRKGRSPRGYLAHVRSWSCCLPVVRRSPGTLQGLTSRRSRDGGPVRRRAGGVRALAQSTPPTATTPPTARAARVGLAGGSGTRERSATGLVKTSTGQPFAAATLRSSLSGLTACGVADHLEHRDVGDRVAVGVAAGEVVAELLGELLDRAGLLLGVRVVLDVAGVLAVLDLHPGGDHPVGAEHLADRLDHLGAGRGHDDDVAPGELVLLDQATRPRRTPAGRRCCAGCRRRSRGPSRRPSRRTSCDMNCRIFSIWSWSAPPTR